jgi:hypothetical protein
LSALAERLHELGEVVLKIACVGEASLGIEIEPDLDIVVSDLHRADEAAQGSQRSTDLLAGCLEAVQLEQRGAKRRGEHCR